MPLDFNYKVHSPLVIIEFCYLMDGMLVKYGCMYLCFWNSFHMTLMVFKLATIYLLPREHFVENKLTL